MKSMTGARWVRSFSLAGDKDGSTDKSWSRGDHTMHAHIQGDLS